MMILVKRRTPPSMTSPIPKATRDVAHTVVQRDDLLDKPANEYLSIDELVERSPLYHAKKPNAHLIMEIQDVFRYM